MAARRDGYGIAEIDFGLAVMIVNGDGCKAAQHVQLRDSLRRLLDAGSATMRSFAVKIVLSSSLSSSVMYRSPVESVCLRI